MVASWEARTDSVRSRFGPRSSRAKSTKAVERFWAHACEVTLAWGNETYNSTYFFAALRAASFFAVAPRKIFFAPEAFAAVVAFAALVFFAALVAFAVLVALVALAFFVLFALFVALTAFAAFVALVGAFASGGVPGRAARRTP